MGKAGAGCGLVAPQEENFMDEEQNGSNLKKTLKKWVLNRCEAGLKVTTVCIRKKN